MNKLYTKIVLTLVSIMMTGAVAHAAGQKKANTSGSVLYGFQYSPNKGLYDINLKGAATKLWSTDYSECAGFITGDSLVAFNQRAVASTAIAYYEIYDLKSGQMVQGQTTLKCSDHQQRIMELAYNSDTKTAYCYTYGSTKSGNKYFQKIDCSNMSQNLKNKFTAIKKTIATANVPAAMTYNSSDKKIYALMSNGDLATISETDGSATVIGNIGITPNSSTEQSLCYSPVDKALFWVGVTNQDRQCSIYTINTNTAEATLKSNLGDGEEYSFVVTADKASAGNTPSAPLVKTNFDKNSLAGSISVTLPNTLVDGSVLTGTVYASIVSDDAAGETIVSGQAGSTVSQTLTLKEGLREIYVTPYTLSGDVRSEGQKATINVYVGNDTPQAPQNVVLAKNSVSWDAIAGIGINGGYVDADNAEYNVYLGDELLTPTPVKETTLTFDDLQSIRKSMQAKVEAIVNGKKSDRGVSNAMDLGQALSVPFAITPTDDEFDLCTILDANKDGNTWELTDTTAIGNSIYYACNTLYPNTADDWFFLPAAKFNSVKKTFLFSVDVKNNGGMSMPEKFEVKIGKEKDPATMTTLIPSTTITNKVWRTQSKEFAVQEEGEYYIGIHCISDEDMWWFFARNFRCEESANSAETPDSVANLTAEGLAGGELKSKVEFNMPSVDRAGNALSKTETLTATVTSQAGTATATALAGEKVSMEVAGIQGYDTLTVVVSNESGKGLESKVVTFCGYDKPKAMALKTAVSEDNMSMTVTWSAPTEGVEGHYVDPAKVYYIVQKSVNSGAYERIDTIQPNADLTYSYTYTSPEDAKEMQQYNIAIVPGIWESGRAEISYAHALLGHPYEIPMNEKFDTYHFAYNPIMVMNYEDSCDATVTYAETSGADGLPEAGVNGQFAIFSYYPTAQAGAGLFMLPKFTTYDVLNGRVGLYIYNYKDMPKTEVYLEGFGVERELAYTIEKSEATGWTQYYFSMPQKFIDLPWVDIQVKPCFEASDGYFLLGGYSVEDAPDHDVQLAKVDGQTYARVGGTVDYKATVINGGSHEEQVDNITMTVKKGAQIIITDKININKVLKVGESYTEEFSFTPNSDQSGNLIVDFSIDIDDDANENNEYETFLNVVKGKQPVVNDLAADTANNVVTLTWTAPEMPKKGVEDFETYAPFTYGTSFGNWQNVDIDGYTVNFSDNLELPDAGKPKAFQVLNYTLLSSRVNLRPYDGDQCLMAFCPYNGYRANDWLVSEEIVPGSKVKFMSRSISSSYPEELQVLTSSADNQTGSFTCLKDATGEDIEIYDSLAVWTEHEFQLPDDAKYFAIRYRSPDEFGILLDAIQYSPVADPAKIVGYNIYRDGIQIAEDVDGLTYTDNTVYGGSHTYNVKAIVDENGERNEYQASNTASVELPGSNADVNRDGTVDISDVNAVISVICGNSTNVYADVNGDGIVDISDVNAVISVICGR